MWWQSPTSALALPPREAHFQSHLGMDGACLTDEEADWGPANTGAMIRGASGRVILTEF